MHSCIPHLSAGVNRQILSALTCSVCWECGPRLQVDSTCIVESASNGFTVTFHPDHLLFLKAILCEWGSINAVVQGIVFVACSDVWIGIVGIGPKAPVKRERWWNPPPMEWNWSPPLNPVMLCTNFTSQGRTCGERAILFDKVHSLTLLTLRAALAEFRKLYKMWRSHFKVWLIWFIVSEGFEYCCFLSQQ